MSTPVPPLKTELEARWIAAPLFRDEAKLSVHCVHDGVMKIQINDVDSRVLMIPLENVEYVDRVWLYLTFHMKSGSKHIIYVGTANESPNDLGAWIVREFAIFVSDQSKKRL